jgi:protein-S-isoprenylcysteine O-methyltransferase Ste14
MNPIKTIYLFFVQFLGYLWYLSSFAILLPFILAELSFGLDYLVFDTWLGQYQIMSMLDQLPDTLINLVALVFFAFGMMVLLESTIALYQDAKSFPFSIIAHKELSPSKLSKAGWYGIVRHPMILAYLSLLVSLGVYLRSPSMLFWWLPILTGVFLEFAVMVEEKALVRWFGQDFKDYQKRVPLLFPRLRSIKKLAK